MSTELDIDVRELEDIFNAPHCEISHVSPEGIPCSHTPIGRKTIKCSGNSYKACLNAVKRTLQRIALRENVCGSCGENVADCWDIVPL